MVGLEFGFARIPEICFGPGKLKRLPDYIRRYGDTVLLVTGGASFQKTANYSQLMDTLAGMGIKAYSVAVTGEPSPALVDEVTGRYRGKGVKVVAAIGGGSAIDAGKAISAMLPLNESVIPYLEAKDNKPHCGNKVPFIAVPTTAGTGAEATKNAVLSQVGELGYKSSLRHDHFVPDVALMDPELALTCPREVTAACGLDAFSQLLEAYVSTAASPMTDALALSGICHFKQGYERTLASGDRDMEARGHMAYASLMSGIVLANAGLGLVHGYAGVIGGYFHVPHGVVCGTLLAEANSATLDVMLQDRLKYKAVLEKYATVSQCLSGMASGSLEDDCRRLIGILEDIVILSSVKRLGCYGIQKADIEKIAARTTNKNNPVKLDMERISAILEKRI